MIVSSCQHVPSVAFAVCALLSVACMLDCRRNTARPFEETSSLVSQTHLQLLVFMTVAVLWQGVTPCCLFVG